MTSSSSRMGAAALAASLALGSAVAAGAAPLPAPGGAGPASNIVKVQAGGGDMGGDTRRRFGGAYRDGYRGDRDWRRDRRHRNDWVPPAAALLGGLIIGGAIANSAQPQPYANPHVDWCFANRPGYNPYDNTYEAYYGGPRVICRSPFY